MTTTATIVLSIIVSIAILLITRALVLWYWKINKRNELIEDLKELILLSSYDQLSSKKITVVNIITKKETKIEIGKFLELSNKKQYKIKL